MHNLSETQFVSVRRLSSAEPSLPDHDQEYWLLNCHGFLVDAPSGEDVGVVEEVEIDAITGLPGALVVACGWFGRRCIKIPSDDVLAVYPSSRRLVVRQASVPIPTTRLS